MTRIIWFSRHQPTERQRTQLQSIFGQISLEHDTHAFDNAAEVVARFKASGADEMVIVAPDAVLRAIIRCGINPIHARMEQVTSRHPEREVTIRPRLGRPRFYRHVRFERVKAAELTTEPLQQNATATSGLEK